MTWLLTVAFCTPLIFSHGVVVPPDTELSYCIFLDNQTISFLPEDWNAKWSKPAFYVSSVLFFLETISSYLYLLFYTYVRCWEPG